MQASNAFQNATRVLHAIAADSETDRRGKVQRILDHGNSWFDTEFALISEVDGDVYTVRFSKSEIAAVEPGSQFPLGDTYCQRTLESAEPVAYHAAGQSELADHPCYNVFQLETYIGMVLHQNGAVFGTVNFSAIESRKPFSEEDLAMVEAIAQTVQGVLFH